MGKIKKIFSSARVMVLLIVLVFSVVAIYPNPWNKGVSIRNVVLNSSANQAGIQNSQPGTQPMSHEKVISINNNI